MRGSERTKVELRELVRAFEIRSRRLWIVFAKLEHAEIIEGLRVVHVDRDSYFKCLVCKTEVTDPDRELTHVVPNVGRVVVL